jgi:hypothetical protein
MFVSSQIIIWVGSLKVKTEKERTWMKIVRGHQMIPLHFLQNALLQQTENIFPQASNKRMQLST